MNVSRIAACAPTWREPTQRSCVAVRMMVNASKVRCTHMEEVVYQLQRWNWQNKTEERVKTPPIDQLILTRLAGLQLTMISLHAKPMARSVSVQVTMA
jgi:hypothetical protein